MQKIKQYIFESFGEKVSKLGWLGKRKYLDNKSEYNILYSRFLVDINDIKNFKKYVKRIEKLLESCEKQHNKYKGDIDSKRMLFKLCDDVKSLLERTLTSKQGTSYKNQGLI